MPPAPNDLAKFMAAIRSVESGGDYRARGPAYHERWGRAQGAYQIMSSIWPSWAAEAGYGGLTESQYLGSPEIQDAIAAHKMSQYYNELGSWDLVAVAWFNGLGSESKKTGARYAKVAGIEALARQGDGFNSVPAYVAKVRNALGGDLSSSGTSKVQLPSGERVTPQQAAQETFVDQAKSPQRQIAQSVMQTLSDAVKANPNSPQTHTAMKQAMQSLLGRDAPTGGTQAVADQPLIAASGAVQGAPMEVGGPGEAPGPGQSGVR